jgi:hypothetical protein
MPCQNSQFLALFCICDHPNLKQERYPLDSDA